MAADWAAKLIGQIPNGKPSDPETYVAGIVKILADYPPEIVVEACDPHYGAASKSNFLPTPKDVIAVCEELMRPHWRAWHSKKNMRKQLEIKEPEISEEQREKIRIGLENLANELMAAPDPIQPRAGGTRVASSAPVAGYAGRVMADLAKRKTA